VAGNSDTPLADKLGAREGQVRVRRRAGGVADVVLAFFVGQKTLEQKPPALGAMIFPSGGRWVAWPKRASGRPTDLSDQVVRALILPTGLVDNNVCAVNEPWSALRFVWRLQNRGGAPGPAN
jgi:hypothetical protein